MEAISNDKVQSLERAFCILDCFTIDHPELGVREAARLAGLSSSTTGRLLAALKAAGVVSQNPATHAYSLGPRVLVWAGVYTHSIDVRSAALELMHELHRTTRETISLYILDGNDRICVERLESPQNVRIVSRVGLRLPLYAGSAGKVLLAFLPPTRRDEILSSSNLVPLTSNTITDPAAIQAEVEKIRRQGYAVSYGEWLLDASGVAAPIFDHRGDVIAALTISGPSQRFTRDKVKEYTEKIVPVAGQISIAMGYLPRR